MRLIRITFYTILFLMFSLTAYSQDDCKFLVWGDEFDYTGLPDSLKWGYDVGDGCPELCGWGNNEQQYYTYRDTDNARVENGHLIIEAKKEEMGGKQYTSARLNTEGLFEMTYGRVDIMAKPPGGNGTWSALWMLGDPDIYGTWPKNGEIDIMEYIGRRPDTVLGTIHCPTNYGGTSDGGLIVVEDAETAFHLYSIEWTPDSIKFMLDNQVYHTYENKNEGAGQWPFDRPFSLILNVAIGGNLGGEIDDDIFNEPVTMEVDYVRVYQQPELSTILGKEKVAKSEANLKYSSLIPANNFLWTVPEDATIISGQGTNEISVNWGCSDGAVKVVLETVCDTVQLSLPVVISPVVMEGEDLIQPKQEGMQFSIPEIDGAAYTWTYPDDAIPVGSTDSNVLTLDWGCNDGLVKVDFTSNCGGGSAQTDVKVVVPKITGQTTAVENATGLVYTVNEILNSTYTWSVPDGVTITDGQGTRSITTNWQKTGGAITVDVGNACGNTTAELEVIISNDVILCDFETTYLTFLPFGGAVYSDTTNPFKEGINESENVGSTLKEENAQDWGGIFADLGYELNFTDKDSLAMDVYGVKAGTILFKLEDESGADPKEISAELTTLNEWTTLYFNFANTEPDVYDRIALFFDFGSTDQDLYFFDNIYQKSNTASSSGINDFSEMKVIVYPNPAGDYLNIRTTDNLRIEEILIVDMMGRTVATHKDQARIIDISELKPGEYLLLIRSEDANHRRLFIKK